MEHIRCQVRMSLKSIHNSTMQQTRVAYDFKEEKCTLIFFHSGINHSTIIVVEEEALCVKMIVLKNRKAVIDGTNQDYVDFNVLLEN